jgi:hypothetical protein
MSAPAKGAPTRQTASVLARHILRSADAREKVPEAQRMAALTRMAGGHSQRLVLGFCTISAISGVVLGFLVGSQRTPAQSREQSSE